MSTFKLIGICGPAGCGKDTAADHIIEQRPEYRKTSFADPIKEMLREGLGLSTEQLYGGLKDTPDNRYGCTPLHMLQTLGTEWGRELVSGSVWVNSMEHYLSNLGGAFVIPDVRFENEATFIRMYGHLIHIKGRTKMIDDTHVSESGVRVAARDYTVLNARAIEPFLTSIAAIADIIEGKN